MAFKNIHDSHAHSLEVLNLIYGYDSFLDSLTTIADMGCGSGLDSEWWATLMTQDDPPEPRDYRVYAVDQDISRLDEQVLKDNPNIIPIQGDFERYGTLPVKVDLIWSHDTLQLATDPYACLSAWKKTLNVNGMLMLSVPQMTYTYNGKLIIESHHQQRFAYNILNLIYMLAINGFDCNDAYFYRKDNSPWLYAAVYAMDMEPMSPNTSWYELAEAGLINDSLVNSVNKYGYARLDDLVVCWLDKQFYKITN